MSGGNRRRRRSLRRRARCGSCGDRDEDFRRSRSQICWAQAYHGSAQHIGDFTERKRAIGEAVKATAYTVQLLKAEGLECDIVAGAGTGTYAMEGTSGVYNELQCGSYIFMDASYQRIRDESWQFVREFENSLFVYASVMSKTRDDRAVCDAGLKALSVDSGMPVVHGRTDVEYLQVLGRARRHQRSEWRLEAEREADADPRTLRSDRESPRLVRRGSEGRVETVWPVTARGKIVLIRLTTPARAFPSPGPPSSPASGWSSSADRAAILRRCRRVARA